MFDLSAMVLEAGGGEAAVAATAASVALADAGIELYDIVPAVQLVGTADVARTWDCLPIR